MDSKGFSDFGKAAIDYIIEYTEGIRDRDVLPSVEPGYLSKLMPTEAPEKAETWQEVLEDVERVIMPGITHWSSPHFHAYYPAANSYPALVGEMIASAIGSVGFSWIASPAATELEVITMNWLGKMIGLPEEFLSCSKGPGGGVIQGSASEATLIALLAAKERTVRRLKKLHPEMDENIIKMKLVAYTSDQSNSSVEKSGILGSMPMRLLPTDENCSLRGSTLLEAIKSDEKNGLIPCYVVATLGTTGTCAFDNLNELGPVCNDNNLWLHIDAAYAGAAFVCPEYRYLMAGIQYADSYNFNPHKWLLVNFDCSAMWVKDSRWLIDAFNVDRIYLNHDKQGLAPDYRHWQIPLGRRFRALKLWCVMRLYGIEGLQKHIKHGIELAGKFEEMVRKDDRFEIITEPALSLVCFRVKGDNSLTKQLVERLMARKRIYVIVATYREKLIIRFTICSRFCQLEDIQYAWAEITSQTKEILESVQYSTETTKGESIDKTAGSIATRLQEVLKIGEKIESQKIS
ncbi:aromatic-L-amino-acid decarboxylase-like [Venturia canescens]|uniref:aromatic-L-amino-acid decarboxylase-like n=1 Tax=Venturia canescens TaxID=32260 RepID=UPI001C9BD13D|nr:aromatic-L-amino-acid decarboxylase-like [Venturia canescens]XP_043275548.1 aromatic-L-amino-acid decarboxylase-like [Venturia canescens]XP_043275549.1 aromatic-L-amino-acid decarboxylase-like [Venturia canescens]XP_043275550.1 aromatic-L-amino-acid decarboxylase-like [Venturia canescens]XP_043275551.1 aromatic-L-amino-acid decarboxylase-like [Venturia canescens]